MSEIKHVYLGDLTAKRGEDGFLRVKGLATDDTLDLDEQICDPAWLAKAMPAWMAIGNVREMHQSKAVGKALEMEQLGSGFYVEAKIVDKDAAMKVEEGIYTGLSVGIKSARVVKDDRAPGGRIVDGKIVEVSLVDRPANPNAVLELAKSVNGELVKGYPLVEEANMEEVAGAPETVYERTLSCEYCNGTGKKDNVPGETSVDCEVCGGSGLQPEEMAEDEPHGSPTIPQDVDENAEVKSADPEVEKRDFTDAERAEAASRGQAMPGGGFPIKTVADLKNAIQAFGRAKDPAATKAHIKARAKALGREDLIPENWKSAEPDLTKDADTWTHDPMMVACVRDSLVELIKAELDELSKGEDETFDVSALLNSLNTFLCWWEKEASEGEVPAPFTESDDTMAYVGLGVSPDLIKSATADDATPEVKDELRTEIVKALGLGDIASETELTAAKEEITLLKAALEDVKAMAAPGGPALRATQEQTQKSAKVLATEIEAERLRRIAADLSNPEMKRLYLDTADNLLTGR